MELAVRLGIPPVTRFVSFIKSVDEFALGDEAAWVHRWDLACDKLEEQGRTVNLDIDAHAPLPPDIEMEAQEVLRDSQIERTFGTVPYHWAWVDLGRVVTLQSYVNVTHAARLASELPKNPSNRDLLRVVMGHKRPSPPYTVRSRDGNHYQFTSVSNDFRVLDTVHLDPCNVRGYLPYGRPCAAVVIYFGYSLNVMCATHMHGRLVLTNGTHRAYQMFAAGRTHGPCLVLEATRERDLSLIGAPQADQPFEWYFKTARPPLLRDFFDNDLVAVVHAPETLFEVALDLRFSTSLVRIPRGSG
jgi:hypothetical protein